MDSSSLIVERALSATQLPTSPSEIDEINGFRAEDLLGPDILVQRSITQGSSDHL